MNTGRNLEPAVNLAEQARVASREGMARQIDELRKDVDRLLLINEALWQIVKEKLGCVDADLVERIHSIDLEDGHLDGRKGPSPIRTCPHCHQPLSKHRPSCVHCGTPVEFLPFER